jgi:hypothetical protein
MCVCAQVLEPERRVEYAAAWTEMEEVLGRSSFHRVFDYMKYMAAAAAEPEVSEACCTQCRQGKYF